MIRRYWPTPGKCSECGEIFFPPRDICQNCQARDLEELILGTEGKIYSYTVMHRSPGSYKGPVPYAFGWVEMPEGVRVETLYTGIAFDKLRVGMDVELVIEKLCDDEEGNEIICHKFRPTTP